MEEDVDPIEELKTIPGVDKEQLEEFEAKASKSASEVQSKRAIPPSANSTLPPPPQPPSLILDDDDHAPRLSGLMRRFPHKTLRVPLARSSWFELLARPGGA